MRANNNNIEINDYIYRQPKVFWLSEEEYEYIIKSLREYRNEKEENRNRE